MKDLVNKKLHSVTLAPFDTALETGEEGSLSFNHSTHNYQGFIGGVWKNFQALTDVEVNDLARYSHLKTANSVDYYVNNRVHMEQRDIGAFPTEHLITGGAII